MPRDVKYAVIPSRTARLLWKAKSDPYFHVFAVSTSSHQGYTEGSEEIPAACAAGVKRFTTSSNARFHPYCQAQARESDPSHVPYGFGAVAPA